MKKIYYISILASLMASQSNFAATDKEEEFLLAFFGTYKQVGFDRQGKYLYLFTSNKIKVSDIKIDRNTSMLYCKKGNSLLSDKIDFGNEKGIDSKIFRTNKSKIFGNFVDFKDANPATIFTKDQIIRFQEELFMENSNDKLGLRKTAVQAMQKGMNKGEFYIISKSGDSASAENYDTFKKRNTSTQIQNPSNNDDINGGGSTSKPPITTKNDETDKTQSNGGSGQESIKINSQQQRPQKNEEQNNQQQRPPKNEEQNNNNVSKKIVLTYKMEKKEDAEALKKAFGETIQKLKVNDKTLTYEIMEADYMKGTKDMKVETQTIKDVQNRLNEVLKSQGETSWNKSYCIRITQKFEKDQKPFAVLKFDANTGNTLEVSIEKAGYLGSSTTAWLLIAVLGAAAAGGTYYAYTQGMLGPKGEGKGENGNEEGENDVEGEE